jgi:hypothetical protein
MLLDILARLGENVVSFLPTLSVFAVDRAYARRYVKWKPWMRRRRMKIIFWTGVFLAASPTELVMVVAVVLYFLFCFRGAKSQGLAFRMARIMKGLAF